MYVSRMYVYTRISDLHKYIILTKT